MRNLSFEISFPHKFIRMQILRHSHLKGFAGTWTRFETKAESNSEMAYQQRVTHVKFDSYIVHVFHNYLSA